MKQKIVLGLGISFIALLSFAFLAPSLASSAASSQSSSQFVTYSIEATNSTRTFSATVNETVSPSSTINISNLTLQLISSSSNFTFSKLVNSSQAILPYLPTIGSQSFSYQSHNYSVSVSIVKTGTSTATISGSPYTITNYSFQISGSKTGGVPMSASGQLSTLPSGLMYSASVSVNGYNAKVQLLATNLALNTTTSTSSSTKTVQIASGVGILAVGLGAIAFYKKRGVNSSDEPKQGEEKKPLYHVD